MNSVGSLLEKPFSQLNDAEKLKVKRLGAPQPQLTDLEQNECHGQGGKPRTRRFNTTWYQRKSWLCGCPLRQKLFCFPCLCFATSVNHGRDTGSKWHTTGVDDMKHDMIMIMIILERDGCAFFFLRRLL